MRCPMLLVVPAVLGLAACGGGGGGGSSAGPLALPSGIAPTTGPSSPSGLPTPTPTAMPTPTPIYSGPPTPVPTATPTPSNANKISHVVIIFQENRSTDNLFHGLPNADTANSGMNSQGQVMPLGPVDLAAPYDIDHSHTSFSKEYNGGNMNGFDLPRFTCYIPSCSILTAYGYVPQSQVQPYFDMAERYTFADRMFQSNAGASWSAHQYITSGTSANAAGSNLLTAENPGYAFNNLGNCDGSNYSRIQMTDPVGNHSWSPPCFEHQTMFDTLDAKGVSYRYYGPWKDGLWNAPDAIYHIRYGPDWANVVTPSSAVLTDIAANALPAVSWVIPLPLSSDHSGATDGSGPSWVSSIVNAVGSSQYWKNTAIFVVWDDWGGWYDHVPPVQYNQAELGFRVPMIVISPYAKPHYVSHVQHEFGSILHFTEETFGLPSLGYTDARADDLADCFNFTQTPLAFQSINSALKASYFMHVRPSSAEVDDDR